MTVAALLVRSGLNGGGGSIAPPVPLVTTTQSRVTTRPKTTTTRKAVPAKRKTYDVQTGDTFGSISSQFGLTVTELQALNPGVSSNSLSIGQTLRVG